MHLCIFHSSKGALLSNDTTGVSWDLGRVEGMVKARRMKIPAASIRGGSTEVTRSSPGDTSEITPKMPQGSVPVPASTANLYCHRGVCIRY